MGFVGFIKTFFLFSVVSFLILGILSRFIPWAKKQPLKTGLILFFLSIAIGYQQGLSTIRSYTESSLRNLQSKEEMSELDMNYFVGDFVPIFKAFGGTLTPEMLAMVNKISKEGPPCQAAMADVVLGKTRDVQSICRNSTK